MVSNAAVSGIMSIAPGRSPGGIIESIKRRRGQPRHVPSHYDRNLTSPPQRLSTLNMCFEKKEVR